MKKFVDEIVSGNFANGQGQNGNFSAYTTGGDRLFVPKKLMEAHNMLKNEDFKPFFAVWEKVLVTVKNPETGEIDREITRDQVKQLFSTEEEALRATLIDEIREQKKQELLESIQDEAAVRKISRVAKLKKLAAEQGLEADDIKSLVASSVA